MKILAHLIFSFFSNLIALVIITRLLPDISITETFEGYATVAAILAALNVFIRPIIRLIMTPLIFLTLGVGVILVNMIILKLLDFLSSQITINGLLALLWASIIVGLINFVMGLTAKGTYQKATSG
ncbi:phage holin family protein [Candidatus Wolfebacteria bacterium]|nr:phage holin family protein [Candidatus Wolfebacteria bacterium]